MLTVTDLFCGAGGSSSGAELVPGVRVRMAANHWRLAVETHNTNLPHADHDVADISQVDPRRYPTTDILWASPECTNHSQARGARRADRQPGLFGDRLPDEAAERSRATMWDVLRFAEHHRYRAIVVENVVEVRDWVMWPAWVTGLDNLGYAHQVVYLNSMFARAAGAPAPQSRDRLYVVAWRKGDRAPDIPKWTRPPAWCPRCEKTVRAVQSWKRPDRPRGRYGQQYVYRCPNLDCRGQQVFPDVLPAAVAIDWTLPGERIGDRARPLAPKTLARIEAGLRRYAQPLLAPAGGTWNDDTRPITEPFRTRTTRDTEALVVPLRNNGVARPAATSPAPTVAAAGNHHALVMRNHTARGDQGQMCTPVTEPLRTILAEGPRPSLIRWDHLLVPYYGNSAARPVGEPMGTVTTVDRNALVGPKVAVEDCTFRMLEPHEIQAAMAFPPGYVVLGNKRERVRQLGNAVTPPAARDLIAAVVEAITGADLEPTNPAAQSTVPAGRNP